MTATKSAVGTYMVDFNINVSQCAYAATIGDPTRIGVLSARLRPSFTDEVEVTTFDADDRKNDGGTPDDRAFHLIVNC